MHEHVGALVVAVVRYYYAAGGGGGWRGGKGVEELGCLYWGEGGVIEWEWPRMHAD